MKHWIFILWFVFILSLNENKEKKEICIDNEAHKKSVIEKLYKVVSIPSAVDVLNGLRKWITIVNSCDVSDLF